MAYLDHAATTPMLPEALEAYVAAASGVGNASSLHGPGRRARRLVEESRERIAAALAARPSEVIFTSGGTESDNLALKGMFWARKAASDRRIRVLASAVEHHAVLDAVQWLSDHEGADVSWLPVDRLGMVHPQTLADALAGESAQDTALVTVMWANNEVGTLQPVAELAAIAAAAGVPMHTDAVQAVGQVPVDFTASGVSALTISGHKLGGPMGVGALLLGRDVACTPLLHGGGQERDVRSGTLDVPAIVAFAAAVEHAVKQQDQQAHRLTQLRDELIARVRQAIPDAVLNGPTPTRVDHELSAVLTSPAPLQDRDHLSEVSRLPANAHFSFPRCEGDALLMLLDAQQIAVSTGSACSAGVAQPSHVLLALGADPVEARSSLRFTLGHTSSGADIDELIAALPGAVERARRATR